METVLFYIWCVSKFCDTLISASISALSYYGRSRLRYCCEKLACKQRAGYDALGNRTDLDAADLQSDDQAVMHADSVCVRSIGEDYVISRGVGLCEVAATIG